MKSLLTLTLLALVAPAGAAEFVPLGDLPGGAFLSRANAVSADGGVVVGYSETDLGRAAFRWSREDGLQGLGELPTGTATSEALGVSADGRVIVGVSSGPAGKEAFRWTIAGGMQGLGDDSTSGALGISADGRVVVGSRTVGPGSEAFRWTRAAGMAGLGDLPGGEFLSSATGASADGRVVVGYSAGAAGFAAFRWTRATGLLGLDALPGGSAESRGAGVSADGRVVVGYASGLVGYEATRWTTDCGVVGLGDLPGGYYSGRAAGASADGRVIVGESNVGRNVPPSGVSAAAFVWTPAHGLQRVADLLVANGAAGLEGWWLWEALGVSGDGQWVVGYGENPAGQTEAFLANPWLAGGVGPGPGGVTLLTLPNGRGSPDPEVVVLSHDVESGAGVLTDYGSAAPLGAFQTTACRTPKAAVVVPDQNGNRIAEVAVLLDDPVAKQPLVEIRDPRTGNRLRTIGFNRDHSGVALAQIADQDGNQAPELVVLADRPGDRPRLLIRDLVTATRVITIALPTTVRPLGLVMAADLSGNGAPEALVLAERLSDHRGYVLIWDTGGTGRVVNVQLPAGHTPLDHAVFSGPGGATAVAVLALDRASQRGRLFVHDALTAARLWLQTLPGGQVPVAVRAYATPAGAARLGVLSQRLADRTPLVVVYRGNTGGLVNRVLFDSAQTPATFTVVPDLTLDPGVQPEFSVLMRDGRLRVRDSVSSVLLQTL